MVAAIAAKISISCSGQVNKQCKRPGFIPAFFFLSAEADGKGFKSGGHPTNTNYR
jgi:hypothetical protein